MANQGKTRKPRTRCLLILAAIVLLVILVIVVPVAVVVSKNASKGSNKQAKVILPLYIYPTTNSTWDPLYAAVQAHPRLNFVVVINPSSGPGSSQTPDNNFANELQKLHRFPNIQKLGYVRTGYATRNVSSVLSEIETYGGWLSKAPEYGMDGIFLDESPHTFSTEADEFMRKVTLAVKNTSGLQGHKTVVRNPGVIPAAQFADANTDLSIIFEETYSAYQNLKSKLSALGSKTSSCGLMVNSVPSMDGSKQRKFAHELLHLCDYIFSTRNTADFYESWGPAWLPFADSVAA